ncbi:MAG: class I SAM-dependent methyltransferase [Enhydrobacter sp.]|nr:MAG: class I SAM-dependent methyltransferase [Enhydrobacter sp.]
MSDDASRIIGLYERHAVAWDSDRTKSLFERPWLDRFTELIPPHGSVLDLGCGSGEPIARHLIGAGFEVTGVDASPVMVGLCRDRFPDGTWIVADMRQLPLGRSFDAILAWDSLFHLTAEDQRRMFRAFACHARPGSVLMFTSGPAAGEAIGSYRGEPLYHASLDGPEYRSLLAGAGFDVIAQANADPACGGHTVWLAVARRI